LTVIAAPNKEMFKKIFLLTSIVLFVVSLTQKCYCTQVSCGDSIAVLLSGSFGFFLCPAAFTWLANPAILISWISFNKNQKKSLITSLIAVCVSISFLFFDKIIINEAGTYGQIVGYRIGYWLWLTSLTLMLLGNLIVYFRARSLVSHNSQTY